MTNDGSLPGRVWINIEGSPATGTDPLSGDHFYAVGFGAAHDATPIVNPIAPVQLSGFFGACNDNGLMAAGGTFSAGYVLAWGTDAGQPSLSNDLQGDSFTLDLQHPPPRGR